MGKSANFSWVRNRTQDSKLPSTFFFGGSEAGYGSDGSFLKVTTVDGSNPAPVEVGSLSHYLQALIPSQVVQDFSHQ